LTSPIGDLSLAFPLMLSLRIAAMTLVIHASLGVALGWALSRRGWPGRTALDVAITLPMVFPPIVLGFLLLLALGRRGLGGWIEITFGAGLIFTQGGILLASVLVGLPLIAKPVQSAIAALPPSLIEAGRTLGHGEVSIFLRIILPCIGGAVGAGLLMATARSLGEVGVTLMLGGNIIGRTNTVSLEIYNAVTAGEFDRALWLSAGLGAFSTLVLVVLRRHDRSNG